MQLTNGTYNIRFLSLTSSDKILYVCALYVNVKMKYSKIKGWNNILLASRYRCYNIKQL